MITFDRPQIQVIRDMPASDIYLSMSSNESGLFYDYDVSFVIDPVQAYQSNARLANISITYKKVNQTFKVLSNIDGSNTNEINSQIKKISQLRKNFIKKIAEEKVLNTVYTTNFDIFANSPKISAFRRKQVGFIDLPSNSSGTSIQLAKIKHQFRLSTSNLPPSGIIIVNVEIKNINNRIVQTVSFEINHFDLVQKYSIPKNLPHAGNSANNKDNIRFNAFVADDRVSGVAVYARKINNSLADVNQQPFKKVYTATVNSSSKYTTAQINQNSTVSYELRSVPALKSGLQLGNIISSTRSLKRQTTISGLVYCLANKNAVQVFIRNIDPKFTYIQVMRKDAENVRSEWQRIGNVEKYVGNDFSFTDTTVRSNKVYMYTALCQDRLGNSKFISTAFVVRTAYYTPGIELAVTSSTEPLITGKFKRNFNISLMLDQKADITSLLDSFKSQGIEIYYDEELKKLSGNLDAIFKIAVKRVDIENNEITDLGVRSIGNFVDTSDANVVYMMEALYRNQADLLEELGSDISTQKAIDPQSALNQGLIISDKLTNKKAITSSNFTQKFLSKKSFLRGTLSYGGTKASGADTSGFLDGRMGVATTAEFSNVLTSATTQNHQIMLTIDKQLLLTFDVSSTAQARNIDYFEIYRIENVTTYLGNCHYNAGSQRQYYLDQITNSRSNNIVYLIKPIKLDGTPLAGITTSALRPE